MDINLLSFSVHLSSWISSVLLSREAQSQRTSKMIQMITRLTQGQNLAGLKGGVCPKGSLGFGGGLPPQSPQNFQGDCYSKTNEWGSGGPAQNVAVWGLGAPRQMPNRPSDKPPPTSMGPTGLPRWQYCTDGTNRREKGSVGLNDADVQSEQSGKNGKGTRHGFGT